MNPPPARPIGELPDEQVVAADTLRSAFGLARVPLNSAVPAARFGLIDEWH
jgi:hypothetical protein